LEEITLEETSYTGIDYGLGQTNRDHVTGIRYGVISQHDVMPEALDDLITQGTDVGFENMRDQAKDELARAIAAAIDPYGQVGDPDELAAEIIGNVEWHDCQEGGPWEFEGDGYFLKLAQDGDVWVLKSPFYTHAQFCSPCAPGAGHLGNPCPTGPKTYCLGPDWFEDGEAPYPIYKVEDVEE
jgi:hypothetical protein